VFPYRATVLATLILSSGSAQAFGLNDLLKQGEQLLKEQSGNSQVQAVSGLDTSTLASGLKEALRVGGERAIEQLASDGGYLQHADVRIPLPGMLQQASSTLRRFGLTQQVDAFEVSMNRAAERAVKEATPLFFDTFSQMTFKDARKIYSGGDTAATDYFRSKSSSQLANKMAPLIEEAMTVTGVTSYYQALSDKAGATLPMLSNSVPDLNAHVTQAAMNGLFKRLGDEERLIRKDPGARSTALLKQVFGR